MASVEKNHFEKTCLNESEEHYNTPYNGYVVRNRKTSYNRQSKMYHSIIGLLSLIICILIGVIICITSFENKNTVVTENVKSHNKRNHQSHKKEDTHRSYTNSTIGPFTEITEKESKLIVEFLKKNKPFVLIDPAISTSESTFIHTIELKSAPKRDVLSYLDSKGPMPERWAIVTIFRADTHPPTVEEYEVGPLPNIKYARIINTNARKTTIPFHIRPFSMAEFRSIFKHILPGVAKKARHLLRESYGAVYGNCENKCLKFSMTPISSAYLAKGERKAWFWFAYDLEFYTLHPLDFQFLVDVTDINPRNWKVQNVWYASTLYPSLDNLLYNYERGTINKTKVNFPEKNIKDIPTSLHQRGVAFPELDQEAPRQYEPSGPRYSVDGNKVKYMKWAFNYRINPTIGLQLFDIRFNGERIMYELSMQEIVVLYTAHNPASSMLYFADSAGLFGTRTRGLLPGIDCPAYATFEDVDMYSSNNNGFRRFKNAICIFEQNNLMPLRRHRAYGRIDSFYGGLLDVNLVVRIMISVINYDYVYDFIFHNNGAVEVKVASTGYLASGFYTPAENPYGTRIQKNVIAHLHHHLFHFKADIDVKGTSNQFQTWKITTENKTDEWSSSAQKSHVQTKLHKSVKQRESNAKYRFNFNHPKYLLFSNANKTDDLGNIKSYRVKINGVTKLKLPKNIGFEPSIPWARYQMAVTKHKDDEYRSSSIYAMWDARDPVVNFQKYIDDNENIVDEDLVAWITIGTHHIPQTEHMPNTPTVGGELTFFITPFNYFSEDPSMASKDAIRVEPKNKAHPLAGAKVTRYGLTVSEFSSNETISLEKLLENDSDFLFY